MRLSSISITGFGGIADRVAIDLSADVIIVVGSNGFGKTTICNAIAWALTGKHPSDSNPRNVYSKSGTTSVALTLRDSEGQDFTVTRSLSNPAETKPAKYEWNLAIETPSNLVRGTSALEWLTSNLAQSEEETNLDAAMQSMVDAIYMKQESLREFLTGHADTDRFSAVAEMVGAGRLRDFVNQLDSAKTAWIKATNKADFDLEARRERVHELTTSRARLQSELAAAESPEVRRRWREWNQSVQGTNEVVPSSQMDVLPLSEESLQMLRQNLSSSRSTLERRYSSLSALLAELAVPLPDPLIKTEKDSTTAILMTANRTESEIKDDLVRVRNRLDVLGEELNRLESVRDDLATVANLLLNHVGNDCPACGQHVDPESFRSRLQRLAAEAERSVEVGDLALMRLEESRLEQRLKEVSRQRIDAERRLQEYAERSAAIAATVSRRRQRVVEAAPILGLDITDGSDQELTQQAAAAIKSELALIERERTKSIDLEQVGIQFESAASVLSARARLARLDEEIRTLSSQLREAELDVEQRKVIGDRANLLAKAVKTDSEGFVKSRIDSLQPILEQFYSAIDPHPTFRKISLLTRVFNGKQRLDPIVYDEESDVSVSDPGRTLSTSQANALAVALFMSFNLGFAKSEMDVLILDDPLQNLDDIHLLGLVDLLRKIAPYRQILVTTHDHSFASLLARKLRPIGDDARTTLVRFTKWDRSGPGIEVRELDRIREPLKLAAYS
ncbi:AAA family ATPase [Pseudarthrobacter sp. NPDC058329]|uniref:AAA family ATPase n=1 Tax=Pseudarthrobacter sp. NPDC058329 TaxID=3346448 RepID=UPI0036DDD050